MPLAYSHPLSDNITCIDTGYQREGLAACYLIESGGEAAFIDTGTSNSVTRLMAVLQDSNIAPSQVKYVIPTHVHLDHAGGSGRLMQQLPEASLLIHPYGARHMIDPSKLIAGTTAVYGEEAFKRSFGELPAVAEDRVIHATDGYTAYLGKRPLLCMDTPGHARHHICIYDEQSNGIFSGDTFGLSYREFDTTNGPLIVPTTTPVQFDPDAWNSTLDRLMSLQPEVFYLTHFGDVRNPPKLEQALRQALDDFCKISLQAGADQAAIHKGLSDWLLRQTKNHGCSLPEEKILRLMSGDLELDAQGLTVWLQRQQQATANQP